MLMDLDPHVVKKVSSVATFIAKSRDVNPCKSHSLVESRNSRVSIETLDFSQVRTILIDGSAMAIGPWT